MSLYSSFYEEKFFILQPIGFGWRQIFCFGRKRHLNNTRPTAFFKVVEDDDRTSEIGGKKEN